MPTAKEASEWLAPKVSCSPESTEIHIEEVIRQY